MVGPCAGVEGGQIRYAHYFEQQLRLIKHSRETVKTEQDQAPAILLHRVRMHTVPHFKGDGGCDPFLTIDVKSELDHCAYTVFQSSSGSPARGPAGAVQASLRSRTSFERMRGKASIERTPSSSDITDVPAEAIPGLGTRVAGDVKVVITLPYLFRPFSFLVQALSLSLPPSLRPSVPPSLTHSAL